MRQQSCFSEVRRFGAITFTMLEVLVNLQRFCKVAMWYIPLVVIVLHRCVRYIILQGSVMKGGIVLHFVAEPYLDMGNGKQ